jgi:hypothetical protein
MTEQPATDGPALYRKHLGYEYNGLIISSGNFIVHVKRGLAFPVHSSIIWNAPLCGVQYKPVCGD